MKNVSIYRRMTGKSQSHFANVLGISVNSYANKEKGRTQFTQKEIESFFLEIIKYFPNLKIEDIFFSTELQKITEI